MHVLDVTDKKYTLGSQGFLMKHLPIIIILFVNIISGFFVAKDYGESWDEANMRSYASTSIKAYDNFFHPEKMQNFYDNEDDRRYYGPAYMMACTLVVELIQPVFNLNADPIYHFLNFLMFQLGLFFFYSINKKFFPTPVAVSATLVFNVQPLFWGHAFINPKDIPIMVLFLGAFDSGLNLINTVPQGETKFNLLSGFTNPWRKTHPDFKNLIKTVQKALPYLMILISVGAVMSIFNLHKAVISMGLNYAVSNPDSIPGSMFQFVANDRHNVPLDSYIGKAVTLVNDAGIFLISIFFAIPLMKGLAQAYHDPIHHSFNLLRQKFNTFFKLVFASIFSRKFWRNYFNYFGKVILEICGKWQFWLAAFLLGFISSIRLNGPYVGVLISIFLLIRNRKKAIPIIAFYAVISFLAMYLLWPYLWGDPIGRYIEALTYMTNFPWNETVLFDGVRYQVNHLPSDYLPRLLIAQFTETATLLLLLGFIFNLYNLIRKKKYLQLNALIVLWAIIPIFAIMFFQIRIYDNFRHIFFLLPPIFLLGSVLIHEIYTKTKLPFFIAIMVLVITPGLYSMIRLHPYEYVYYNAAFGGLEGAKDKYELDYYGTSIKEATEFLNGIAPEGSTVFVYAPLHLVEAYARPDLVLIPEKDIDGIKNETYSINLNRFNWGNKKFPDDVDIYAVERDGAIFTSIRKVK